jgi:ABC-2 type transport system ATP-binding protein
MIELQTVTKLYGKVIGVNEISLTMDSGIYGLLGPNGSGKTTLINLIIGQLRPTIGRVTLFGQDPWSRDYLLREVGLCPAIESHIPRVNALDWVTHLVRMHGFSRADARQRAIDALTRMRMDHAMKRPMRDYSLGMRQRVKLAQAIAHEPRLLILDEPFNGLDPEARFEMTQFLQQWSREGRSLILSSHILHEVEAVHPSFLLLSGGRLLASGSPDEVRRILADSPNRVTVRCSNPRRLAGLLVNSEHVDSVRLLDSRQSVEITARSASPIFLQLPDLTRAEGIQVQEIQSAEESLKELFTTLMKHHRGEV